MFMSGQVKNNKVFSMLRYTQILVMLLLAIDCAAGVKVEKLHNKKKELIGYVVANNFFKAVLVAPGKYSSSKYGADIVRGGWFKDIILKNADKGLLGSGKSPYGDFRFGLTQLFEPEISLKLNQKVVWVPGIGKGQVDKDGNLIVSEFFPWKSQIIEKNKKLIVSYSQTANATSDYSYKIRIDCEFNDSAIVKLKGIFFNTGKQTFKANVSPSPIFELPIENTPWVTVPYQRSKTLKKGRINYICTAPLSIKELKKNYVFAGNRLSKAKRWVAAGGLAGDGIFVFKSKALFEKVIYWKGVSCFSVYPTVKIEAKPGDRVEWEWDLVFGRGLKEVSAISSKGVYGVRTYDAKSGTRLMCEIAFMPYDTEKGLIMEPVFKSATGKMIALKSNEMLTISPLRPGKAIIMMSDRIVKGERYRVDIEMLKNDEYYDAKEVWIYP
jgi:hypothetical protein